MNRLMSALMSLAIVCGVCMPLMAEDPNPQDPRSRIMQVYNYASGYAIMTSVYDETSDKFTFLSNGMNRTGYYGDDGSFIETDRTVYHPNGQAALTVSADGTYKRFSETGVMQEAWTTWVIDENNDGIIQDTEIKKSYAEITYDEQGRLKSVAYQGWVDGYKENANGKHVQNNKVDPGEMQVTRVEEYSADGKLQTVTSYTYYAEKDENNNGEIDPDEQRWYCDEAGKHKKIEATETYKYDAAGNLYKIVSASDYIKEKGGDAGDNTGEMKETGYITVEFGRYQKQYLYTKAGRPGTAEVATVWHYSKNGAMVKQVSYEPKDEDDILDNATEMQRVRIKSSTFFDNHQRKSYATDKQGYVTERWFYNDTSRTRTMELESEGMIFTIKPGGCLKHEKYAWTQGHATADIHRTFYHAGNLNTPAIMVNAGDITAEQNIQGNNPGIAASYDVTAQGTLSYENGNILFTITDEATYNEMIASLDAAIESASGDERTALEHIKESITKQWKGSCQVTLVVGAVDESGAWDEAQMQEMFNMAMHPEDPANPTITLNWGNWGQKVKQNKQGENVYGRVWIFV